MPRVRGMAKSFQRRKKESRLPSSRESAFEHDRLHADLFCDLGTCFHNPRELLIRFNLGRCTNKPTIDVLYVTFGNFHKPVDVLNQ